MIAGVGDSLDADQLAGDGGTPAGDRADHAEAPAEPRQRLPGLRRDGGLLGALDDRRQGSVDVGEDRGVGGVVTERDEQRCGPLADRVGGHRL